MCTLQRGSIAPLSDSKNKPCFSINGSKADSFMSNWDIQQGENLFPILFSLSLNDLDEFMVLGGNRSLKPEADICNGYMKLFVLMYADDTVLLSNSKVGLQNA